jgi:hypothetical protein
LREKRQKARRKGGWIFIPTRTTPRRAVEEKDAGFFFFFSFSFPFSFSFSFRLSKSSSLAPLYWKWLGKEGGGRGEMSWFHW